MAIGEQTARLLKGLYSPQIADEVAGVAEQYDKKQHENSYFVAVPSSLHSVTDKREMRDSYIELDPKNRPTSGLLELLGVYNNGQINGSMVHVLARLFTTPRMIKGYIDNFPTPAELAVYKDPPFLQLPPEVLKSHFDNYFATAAEALSDPEERLQRFRLLGEVGQEFAWRDIAYPAVGSTQAYETFGMFHLFPANRTVDITATSPGVILPTEADPLKFKDVVAEKNLLRPTYFEMLRQSVDIGGGRKRRYSANREGTAKSLRKYPQLAGAAKDILADYLGLDDSFQIRLGDQSAPMKLATLIGDLGVVYSVRDPADSKIAHNVTVMSMKEAQRLRKEFEKQWAEGTLITSTGVVDELIAA